MKRFINVNVFWMSALNKQVAVQNNRKSYALMSLKPSPKVSVTSATVTMA